MIITKNLSDFPAELLAARGVRAVHPDVFLLDLVRQDTETVHAIVVAIAAAWKDPCATVVDVAASLAFEAPLSAEALRRHLGQSR
ncbi:MAG: hypothetical protein LBH68_04380 [Bifidobacteriaceae bacterium]|nr:hypothetical protein [Bifidobacteriaceae bacterium]